jgi:glycosyltransferase involved in cell wall biosynthesis
VVASPVWGTPEVVRAPEAGLLMTAPGDQGVVEAVRRLLDRPPSRAATRRYAENFGWGPTTEGQLTLFRSILGNQSNRAA